MPNVTLALLIMGIISRGTCLIILNVPFSLFRDRTLGHILKLRNIGTTIVMNCMSVAFLFIYSFYIKKCHPEVRFDLLIAFLNF